MNFDKYMHQFNHQIDQDVEYFHYPNSLLVTPALDPTLLRVPHITTLPPINMI